MAERQQHGSGHGAPLHRVRPEIYGNAPPMHRAVLALALILPPAAHAEIRSAGDCAAAVAENPEAAREDAAVWTRLGGGTPAELCEAAALEAMGATLSAARRLTELAGDRRRAHPPDLRAAIYLDAARLWLDAGRPDLARAALANRARLTPATAESLTLGARAAAAAGDWPGALETLDALIALRPDDARAHALRAAALRRSGDPAAALTEARAALALAPTMPEALFEAAAAEAESGDALAAETLWLRLIAAHPDHDLATLARRNLVTQH